MSDRPDSQAKFSGVAMVAVVVLLVSLPVLYVLSIGPVVWLEQHECVSESVEYIYLPLSLVAEYCQPVKQALIWYLRLWVDLE